MCFSTNSPLPLVCQTEQRSNRYAGGATRAATGNSMSSAVFGQSIWYLLSFYLTWPPYLALQYYWASGSGYSSYPFVLFACTLVPLQGFWNCVGYFRKRANRKLREVGGRISSSVPRLLRYTQQSDTAPATGASGPESSTTASRVKITNDGNALCETEEGFVDRKGNDVASHSLAEVRSISNTV